MCALNARKNMKKHFPNLRFRKSYVSIRDIKWFHDWIDEAYGDC